jgi:Zn finger protein HypA/HybF involved in hydrogenase expression
MANCAKCGKAVGLMVINRPAFGAALRSGMFSECKGKRICHTCQDKLLSSQGIDSGFGGVRQITASAVVNSRYPESVKKPTNWKNCLYCGFSSKTQLLTSSTEKQNVANFGFITIAGQASLEHQYSNKYSCSKFGFDLTNKDNLAETCSSYITKDEYEKKCLNGEINKNTNVQIIIDFSSLKEAMSKGGLVMTTYKCPNCNGMVNIPEAGKVLVCQYCGTPIKPVDIFEKIKSLIT